METKTLILAPIDEKNITSDWIEDIFDTYCFGGRKDNICVGFVNDCVVICSYFGNCIDWKVESEHFNYSAPARTSAFSELKTRLKAIEEENPDVVVKSSVCNETLCITQSFYFKNAE